ncbi:hypothetical protein [Stenotrophomonas maltophilia]|uniref:hypothetical protein n=1 Tax=Stenotrophomonas maltophilia TaxID=40324 RepID=UPI00387697F2
MSRDTRKKRKKSKGKPKRSYVGPVLSPMPRLFRDDLSDDERRDAINAMAKSFGNARDKAFTTISRFVVNFDPLHALSVLAAYGLSIDVTKEGVRANEMKRDKIHQDHVELLQALVLQKTVRDWPRQQAQPPDTQELWDALIELGHGFDLSRMRPVDMENESDALVMLQEKIRGNTRAVRNWGYYHQVKDIGHRLLAPLDEKLRSALGFAGTELIAVLDSLVRANETRINEHRRKFFGAIGKSSVAEIVNAYAEAMPETECSGLLDYFAQNDFSLQQAKALLLAHSELALENCFTHEAGEVSARSGVGVDQTKAIFRALGLVPGELNGRSAELFLLDNPVWTSPWIALSEDTIFACIPQTAFSFLFEIVERLLASNEPLKVAWHDRRAAFLEADVAATLSKALPGAAVYRNIRWRVSGTERQGETDTLVVLDSVAIIVEAKSGSVSAHSRRGAPDRLKSEIRDLLESPALQSQRLLAAMEEHLAGKSELILSEQVDLSQIRYIMRMSVTLEDFSTIQSNIGKLQALRLVSRDVEPVPTLCLADLHTLVEILDVPVMFLHYLHRRMHLEGKFSHDSDELDLLGTYLMNGLLFGNKETDGTRITFYRMSERIDTYMMSLSEGILTAKPRRLLDGPWAGILERVLHVRSHRWPEIAIMLLDVDYRAEKTLARDVRELIKRHRYQRTTHYQNILVYLPDGIGWSAIATVVLRKEAIVHRQEAASAAAEKSFEDPRPTRCLLLIYDANASTFPYNHLVLADRLQAPAEDKVGNTRLRPPGDAGDGPEDSAEETPK